VNRKTRFSVLCVALCLALSLWAADQPLVNAKRLQEHVNYLAGPKMRGRGTGTKELERAGRYIADHFKKAGLEPGAGKSYFQAFPVTVGAELGKQNRAEVVRGAQREVLRAGQEYIPLTFSNSGEASVPVVFAGYGISSQEHNYDDYAGLDAQGKAVIVLRHEPQEEDEKSIFAGKQLTTHSDIISKAINARLHGARAMILVNDPVPHATEEDLLIKFGSQQGPTDENLLLIHAKRDIVDKWLAASGKTLVQLQKAIDEKPAPQSFAVPDVTLHLQVNVRRINASTRNVIGILRGSDPKLAGEAIVIGAHYDHLGLGNSNSSMDKQSVGKIHAGADDNASGTAALLELASTLAPLRAKLRRSVIFIAFSAEELGLNGSSYYTKNPTWPLEKTAAMINLDMVGRPRDNKLYVGGIGTSPIFKEILDRANTVGLQLSASSQGGYGSSDHQSFYVKNVPVLFFFSGLHADYHKPTDTPDRIHNADHARVVELALHTAQELAARDDRPLFVRVQEPQPQMGGGGGGYGAYFGSIPDMGEEVNGVKFADVRDASPAALAGLKAGDVLVEFAGKEIKNLYDFTYALRAHKPGDEVSVTVLRGAERITVKVKLAQRR